MTQAAFVEFLGEHGLTGVDGARTIEQLGRQYGVRRWYDFIEAIRKSTANRHLWLRQLVDEGIYPSTDLFVGAIAFAGSWVGSFQL